MLNRLVEIFTNLKALNVLIQLVKDVINMIEYKDYISSSESH